MDKETISEIIGNLQKATRGLTLEQINKVTAINEDIKEATRRYTEEEVFIGTYMWLAIGKKKFDKYISGETLNRIYLMMIEERNLLDKTIKREEALSDERIKNKMEEEVSLILAERKIEDDS